ncbi:hypothetical protein [Gymnodinialimonas sp.]
MKPETRELLLASANEHFAHGRDHEHLRGQITAIISGAAGVLLGLALDEGNRTDLFLPTCADRDPDFSIVYVSAIALCLLNVRLIALHNRLFDAHTRTANFIMRRLENSKETSLAEIRSYFGKLKQSGAEDRYWGTLPRPGFRFGLSKTWFLVPAFILLISIEASVAPICHSINSIRWHNPENVASENAG